MLWQLVEMYNGIEHFSIFKKTHYRILPERIRENGHIFIIVFSVELWTILLIGILLIKPYLISIWLFINTFLIEVDIFILLFEIMTNQTEHVFITFVSETCFLCTVLLIKCVRDIFQKYCST